MKLITRDTDYAVRAICYLVEQKKRLVSATELVKALRIPRPFLRKILQILNKHKFLKSYKGNNGGFSLVVPADKIYLVDLMEVFQGPFQLNKCLFNKRICSERSSCRLRMKINAIEGDVVSALRSINIASLLR